MAKAPGYTGTRHARHARDGRPALVWQERHLMAVGYGATRRKHVAQDAPVAPHHWPKLLEIGLRASSAFADGAERATARTAGLSASMQVRIRSASQGRPECRRRSRAWPGASH